MCLIILTKMDSNFRFSSGEKNFKVQVELCRRFFQLVEDPGTSQNMVHVLKLLWAFLKLLPFFSQAEVDNIMASDFGKALIEGQNSPDKHGSIWECSMH